MCVCVDIKGWKALTKYLAGSRKSFILTTFYLFTNLFLFITFYNRNTSTTQI